MLCHSGGAHHGFVLLEIVDKLPLFVFGVVVDYVNPLAFCRAGNACDAAGISGSEPGGRGWLARRGEKLLNHVPGLRALSIGARGRRGSRCRGLRPKLAWILWERKRLALHWRHAWGRVRRDWLSAKLRLWRKLGLLWLLHGLIGIGRLLRRLVGIDGLLRRLVGVRGRRLQRWLLRLLWRWVGIRICGLAPG